MPNFLLCGNRLSMTGWRTDAKAAYPMSQRLHLHQRSDQRLIRISNL